MRHRIDIEQFERKNSIHFFQNFPDPNISITSEVECTGARARAKARGVSFFLYYAHAMLKACNEIKEFKYRMDTAGELYYYDTIDALAVIRTGENGRYNTLRFPYHEELQTFAQTACRIIDEHEVSTSPFESEEDCPQDDLGVFLLSALPTLSFTGISFAHQSAMDGYPLSLIGKLIQREGKEYIPIGLKVNHAFIDGHHLALYYQRVSTLLMTS
ncbi:CatA-like O-acetyltransferase [Parabacteroides sp. PF5-6]|uniref:CatA-like O-acetyltransferase n=1 Tax=Parabacteroides sp. PF5-6 TaxID=1742403 RepID=UPI0024059D7F|nr:CatA-like O-acetyltransferase [Parabacteroides sp. PF5-6]MDF9830895.1 chloramphenicol O-acetyltransferase type A [Parabacteroides sp. PF5-6]